MSCTFDLRTLERVDATAGSSVIRVCGALTTTGAKTTPILFLRSPAASRVLQPLWTTQEHETWTAEYAVAAAQLDEPGAELILVLPNGRLVDLPPPDRARPRRGIPRQAVALGLAACTTLSIGAWGASQATRGAEPAAAPSRVAIVASTKGSGEPAARMTPMQAVGRTPGGSSLVAHATARRVGLYRSPTAKRAWTFLRNPNAMGAPTVFLVRSARGDRFKVALPIRPNGATAWIRAVDVRLATVAFRVDVDLTRHELTVRRSGKAVVRSPIGVGRSLTPTPSGLVLRHGAARAAQPRGIYGPYAYALSAHSTVLDEFAGGDGRIGLHGTNSPSGIGSDVSHGCIRIPNRVIRRLARMLPLGTPVRILR